MMQLVSMKKQFLLSHAGIPPIWGAEQALTLSQEVEDALQNDDIHNFLNEMYGNNPNCWQDSLEGNDRLRVITNYFTRMRFCDENGKLELTAKKSPLEAPKGFKPWYSFPNKHLLNEKIVFGHWAALEGESNIPNIFAIDTGCVWGNSLTALRLEDEQLFSCSAAE